jgi:hypothetical protein
MLLNFENGDPFATGSAPYDYRQFRTAPRIFIKIDVEGQEVDAFLDTGGVYFLCSPELAEKVGIDPTTAAPQSHEITMARVTVRGVLHRLPITLLSDSGADYPIEVTAFFPDPDQALGEKLSVSYLGMWCCMERFRFAIDPHQQRFYFGPCP